MYILNLSNPMKYRQYISYIYRPRSSLVIGYNAPHKTVWFLGGLGDGGFVRQSWSLNLSTSPVTWTEWPSLSFTIYARLQTYTNINNIIYWNLNGDIGTFNMETQQIEYPSSVIPSLYHNTTSIGMTTDGRYLFALSGSDYNLFFQIYDTYSSNSKWFLGPQMPHGRYRFSCHTSKNHELYVIGGTHPDDYTFLDTIIKINISDIDNINSGFYSWTVLNDNLPIPVGYHRSVEYADLIYIIGGRISKHDRTNKVVVLDTITDKIIDVQDLNEIRSSSASVVAMGRIYVFGTVLLFSLSLFLFSFFFF